MESLGQDETLAQLLELKPFTPQKTVELNVSPEAAWLTLLPWTKAWFTSRGQTRRVNQLVLMIRSVFECMQSTSDCSFCMLKSTIPTCSASAFARSAVWPLEHFHKENSGGIPGGWDSETTIDVRIVSHAEAFRMVNLVNRHPLIHVWQTLVDFLHFRWLKEEEIWKQTHWSAPNLLRKLLEEWSIWIQFFGCLRRTYLTESLRQCMLWRFAGGGRQQRQQLRGLDCLLTVGGTGSWPWDVLYSQVGLVEDAWVRVVAIEESGLLYTEDRSNHIPPIWSICLFRHGFFGMWVL